MKNSQLAFDKLNRKRKKLAHLCIFHLNRDEVEEAYKKVKQFNIVDKACFTIWK